MKKTKRTRPGTHAPKTSVAASEKSDPKYDAGYAAGYRDAWLSAIRYGKVEIVPTKDRAS
jgi:hypothetical protein